MKSFRLLFQASLAVLMSALIFSCQQDDIVTSSTGVSFILSPGLVQDEGARIKQGDHELPTVEEGMCDLGYASYAEIVIEGVSDDITIPIHKWGSNYKTDLVELTPGNYKILSFVVYNDQDKAIFATPNKDSEFAPFVSAALPVEFSVSLYAISEHQVEVLCIENFTPTEFGFPFWDITLKATKQLCIFGNYCIPDQGPTVADLEAWVYPDDQHTTTADLIWWARSDAKDADPENNLLRLKFPYDPELPAQDQSFYVMLKTTDVFLTATISLDYIDMINESKGYLHLNKNCQDDFKPFQISDEHRIAILKDLDLRIHYRVIGEGPTTMIFVPGWTNPLTVFTKQFDYFRDKARSIYIDLPGQGRSDAPSPGNPLDPSVPGLQYTMELMAEAVYTVVQKEGCQDFVAVGSASGPRVWGMFERIYPGMITKLVNLDGGFFPWPSDPTEREIRQANREATYLAQLEWDYNDKKALGDFLVPPSSPDDLLDWVEYFYVYPSDILANSHYYIDAEKVNEPVGWTYPKLCFYATPNPNMNKVNWIYPNNTTYSFPGGGHAIFWIFHEEINPIIWNFVKE